MKCNNRYYESCDCPRCSGHGEDLVGSECDSCGGTGLVSRGDRDDIMVSILHSNPTA